MTENKEKKSFIKRTSKVLLYIVLFFVVISIALVILAQMPWFRGWALEKGLSIANSSLNGRVEVKDLTFSAFDGINLHGIRVYAGGDTVAQVPELNVSLNYMPLLKNKVVVNKLTLKQPVIKMLRGKDSLWNFSKIAQPSTDTSKGAPSEWIIDIGGLNIKNGSFILADSLSLQDTGGEVNFAHMYLDNLNLSLSAKADLGENDFRADIEDLSFYEIYSGLKIDKFKTLAKFNKKGISAEDTRISAFESEINFDASIDSVNLFEGG
ncbi:MAG: AsmA family protein, partial [Candidatus Kapaibacterium sp.]